MTQLAKPVLRFVLITLGLYTVLVITSHYAKFGKAYRSGFTGIVEALFQDYNNPSLGKLKAGEARIKFSNKGMVEFKPNSEVDTGLRMRLFNHVQLEKEILKVQKKGAGRLNVQTKNYKMDTWPYAFLPLLFLFVLILSSPVHWKRRLIALPIGFLLFHLFIYLKLRLDLLVYFNRNAFLDVALMGEGGKAFFESVHRVTFSITFNLIITVFIWLLVTFRKEDWQRLRKG